MVSGVSLIVELFSDRTEVGKLLADRLLKMKLQNPIVLAIPRGGVPVAKEIALTLGADLDLVITRKIGHPDQPEFAIGAITQEGRLIVEQGLIKRYAISKSYLREETERQKREILDRMRKYRGDAEYPDLAGKTVIIVDDGVATGNTMLAAIESVKEKKPAAIMVAIGVAPASTIRQLSTKVDQVVCLDTPEPFYAIGEFYERFEQVEDDQVKKALAEVALHSKQQQDHGTQDASRLLKSHQSIPASGVE